MPMNPGELLKRTLRLPPDLKLGHSLDMLVSHAVNFTVWNAVNQLKYAHFQLIEDRKNEIL